MIIVLTIGSICFSVSTQHVLGCAAVYFAEKSICALCFVLCALCICVVAQIKISHEAVAVPIRIKKPNHRNSVAQIRLTRHAAEFRKQNIPKRFRLKHFLVWYLHFLIFRYTCNVDTAYNTPCLHLILGTSGCTAWWHLAHCCAIFHMHFNAFMHYSRLDTDCSACWWEKVSKAPQLPLCAGFLCYSLLCQDDH